MGHKPTISGYNQKTGKDRPITAEAIRAQLGRILSSPSVVATPQLSRFLRFVVEESLNGRSGQIKQYTVAVKALGRSPDFNPQADAIVRIEARRLRRALNKYYLTQGKNDSIQIEIPTGGYKPVFQLRKVANPQSLEADKVETLSQKAQQPAQEQKTKPILAVLALSNQCQDDSCIYLADGMTEEILNALTRFSELPVMGPLYRE